MHAVWKTLHAMESIGLGGSHLPDTRMQQELHVEAEPVVPF